MSQNKNTNPISSIYEWVEVICTALFTVVVLFTFVMRMVTVSGESMERTFQNADRLIISDLFYTPKGGDVVVLQDVTSSHELQGPIIKRVIATEGETVDIKDDWTVTVTHKDGSVSVLDEKYVNHKNLVTGEEYKYMMIPHDEYKYSYPDVVTEYPHRVKDGHVFVMGDNRNNSLDSRLLGDIDERMILGKVYLRVFPHPAFDFSK